MQSPLRREPPFESTVAAGRCRLVAQITAVDTSDKRCLQFPCRATARVLETRGYGSAFGPALAKGEEISLFFEFGLSRTTRQLANGKLELTGLTVGETFQADIQGGGGESKGGNAFTVFEYLKK